MLSIPQKQCSTYDQRHCPLSSLGSLPLPTTHVCADGDGNWGVSFSFFFSSQLDYACFIEKGTKPQKAVKGESGKLEQVE